MSSSVPSSLPVRCITSGDDDLELKRSIAVPSLALAVVAAAAASSHAASIRLRAASEIRIMLWFAGLSPGSKSSSSSSAVSEGVANSKMRSSSSYSL